MKFSGRYFSTQRSTSLKVKHKTLYSVKPSPALNLDILQGWIVMGHAETLHSVFLCFADLQHYLLVSVPFGQGARDPRTVVPGSDKRLPWGQGAKQ